MLQLSVKAFLLCWWARNSISQEWSKESQKQWITQNEYPPEIFGFFLNIFKTIPPEKVAFCSLICGIMHVLSKNGYPKNVKQKLDEGFSTNAIWGNFALRTLRRMFSYVEFPRALSWSKALVTRMLSFLKVLDTNCVSLAQIAWHATLCVPVFESFSAMFGKYRKIFGNSGNVETKILCIWSQLFKLKGF